MGRIKELDGLRAIAVLGVLAAHFVPQGTRAANALGLGWAGVDLFFAISGFLITGILIGLRQREAPFRTFYWRRTLRIFPPYYIALALLLALALVHTERINYRDVARHAMFLSSVTPGLVKLAVSRLFFQISAVPLTGLKHTEYLLLQFKDCFGIYWSLSVEELFYLVWAPIVLKGSRRMVCFCSVAPLLVCPILRGLAHTTPHIDESIGFVFRFDSLAAGGCVALLFWGMDNGHLKKKVLDRALTSIIIFSSLSLFFVMKACGIWRGIDVRTTSTFSVAGFSLLAMMCASLVGAFVRWSGKLGFLSYVLRSKSAVYVGTVSYTIYLIHLPTYLMVQLLILKWFGPNAIASSRGLALLSGVLAAAFTILLAGLSWKYIEAPIMRLKEAFFPGRTTPHAVLVESNLDGSGRLCA
jgi:peptidoglycan/LPS O-acetylase OafA/YrhL